MRSPAKRPVRLALVGPGAFGLKHLDALGNIEDATVSTIVSDRLDHARRVAASYGVAHASADLLAVLADDDLDAVILTTPTPLHAEQAVAALNAGKHVQVEIPLADNWLAARQVAELQRATGLVCMVGHTRRFNPSHRWVHRQIETGRLVLQHLDVRTHFLRRSNLNALNQPRTWTDHLLWHHAAHTVDLLRYQTGDEIVSGHALQGPRHPDLGIAMDMSVQLLTSGGTLCTLSLSFNNDGPFGSVFRYIGDTGTYIAHYDDLVTGHQKSVDLTGIDGPRNGIEAQDREFIAAIRHRRQPEASVVSVLPTYQVLDVLERELTRQRPRRCPPVPTATRPTAPRYWNTPDDHC